MASVDDPRIGTIVMDKLRVDALLGAGGMGAVYRVHHLVTKHDRALKVLHPELAKDEDVIKRLTREAGVAGTLRSPHVVETLDVGHLDDDSPFVLMELLDGESLADRMERGAIPKQDLITFVCQACQGVMHAHAAGIVHRDLKPENLFIVRSPDGDERIKILDFGISKFQVETLEDGSVTREGTVLGTPLYMSPEQSTGQADLGPATDIYSLGVILYEGLSGSTPHEAVNFPQLLVRLNTEPPKPLGEVVPGLEPELAAVVDKALSIDPRDRPESAEALLCALAPFADRRRIQHLDALRDAPPMAPKAVMISMADTMAGGLVDELRPSERPPPSIPSERRPSTPPSPTSAPASSTRGSNRTQSLEPSPKAASSTMDEVIEADVPRPAWMPWAIAAGAAIALIAGLAFFYGGDEGDGGDPGAADPAPTIADEPEPALPEGLSEPARPEPTLAEPTRPEPAQGEPPPPAPAQPEAETGAEELPPAAPRAAPSKRPAPPREPRPGPARHDIARDNPYE